MRLLLLMVLVLLAPSVASAQAPTGALHVVIHFHEQPVAGAEVSVAGTRHTADAQGQVTVDAPAGTVEVLVNAAGLSPARVVARVVPGASQTLTIELEAVPVIEEQVTVVATTRTNARLDDQPMRVEVLAREEIEEKMLMTPGDIVMMLNEMGGMRVQSTSPSLGAASVRIQGMRGRYTRVLSDGLPLFGDVGGLGLLQIPPMDLGQVEVIKGVASALYGAGAMGGVVNLLSRRPGAEPTTEFLVNRSTRGGTDVVGFGSRALPGRWGASLLAGGHWQEKTDVSGDGWADLAGYNRGVLRPRVFWDDGAGQSLFATAGVTYEDRRGGTVENDVLAASGLPDAEALDTRKYDAGLVGQAVVADRVVVTARFAAARQRHRHRFGEVVEPDRHDTVFAELAGRASVGRSTWVAGVALQRDAYDAQAVPRFSYTFTAPGLFVQHDMAVTPAFSLSSSGRLDLHSEYGAFFSPRVSSLWRAGGWSSRFSIGTGFYAATPITEETEAAGLSRLSAPAPLEAERGLSTSFDLTRQHGPLALTATLFGSRITDAVHVERAPRYVISNLAGPTTNVGAELLATLRHEPWSLTGTYTYVRAKQTEETQAQAVPLTPRHSLGIVGVWEKEDVGRIGLELYYTGRQRLDADPYRRDSRPYAVLGLLAERQFGRLRLFVNGENLTDVRQTRWNPLLTPTRAPDGRWTVDAWAPLEGRNVNGGVRVRF